jgi:parallel beta-helix repeat protein
VNTTGFGGAYTSIQDAISDASDGDTIFVFSGTYEEELWIYRSVNLVGENADTTIINGDATGYVVNIVADNVKISNFTFTSDKAFKGLLVETDNNTISNNIFTINQQGSSLFLIDSHENNITKNTFSSPSQWGIWCNFSSNNSITDNIISDAYAGIMLEYSSNNVIIARNRITSNFYRSIDTINSDHLDIIENTISNNDKGMVFSYAEGSNIIGNEILNNKEGLSISYANGSNLKYNNISFNNINGFRIVGSSFCNISSNNIFSYQIHGISMHSSHYNMISNNNIHSSNWSNLRLYLSSNNTIIDNDISSSGSGIYLDSSLDNNISNNNIENCSHPIMMFKQSNYNVFTENELYDNEETIINNSHNNEISFNNLIECLALEFTESDNSRIFNNTITGGSGIRTYQSDYSYIFNNTIIETWGISLLDSNNWSISGNYIMSNSYGIKLYSSMDNTIYHNSFINNDVQAEDDSNNSNKWDNGYPSGGNYWSDYSGFDKFNGPNQNIPGMDAIGDTNYMIDSDSKDRYPFMESIPDAIPPRIKLIKPENNSAVKVDSFIDFDIYDGNLDYVEYSVNNGERHSLSSPFDISTQDWADGNYSIEIYAYDYYGNLNSSSFQISVDATPPVIISVTPTDGSLDVPIDTKITVVFSEPMNTQSVGSHLSLDPNASLLIHWNEDRTVLEISFRDKKPEAGTTYRLLIQSNATDANGNRMESDYRMEFTTEAKILGIDVDILILILLIITIIIIIIVSLFLIKKKKKKSESESQSLPKENELPPPPPPPD